MKKSKIIATLVALALLASCTPRTAVPVEEPLEEVAAFEFPDTPVTQEPEKEIPEIVEKAKAEKEDEGKKVDKKAAKKELPTTPVEPDKTPPTPHPLKEVRSISEEDLSVALSRPLDELEALDNTSIIWGPGGTSQEYPPVAVVDLQKQYGVHGALFLSPDSPEIFLSFDEGYELGYTPALIDTLTEKGVTGVFFVSLGYVESRPDLVRKMIDQGHIIGNHSSAHPVGGMPTLSAADQGKDILYLHNFVKENFGYEMTLFRPPEGTFSLQSLEVAKSLGYTSTFWSFAYNDWNPDNQMEPEKALEAILGQTHPGAVYLLHGVSSTNATILGNVIDDIREKGYSIGDWSHIV